MKKLIIIVVIIIAILGVLFIYSGGFPPTDCTNEVDCVPVTATSTMVNKNQSPLFSMTKINHISLTVDDGGQKKQIELTRTGTEKKFGAEFKSSDSPMAGSVIVLDEQALHVASSGDVFIPYAVNYGGSGFFVSVGLFTQKDDVTLLMQDTYLVGDRVLIDHLAFTADRTPHALHIHYRDRKDGESFAATPTVPKEAVVAVLVHVFGGKIQ